MFAVLGFRRLATENPFLSPKFGVYKSLCCGAEIVITKGAIFPKCPDHPQYTTIWKLLPEEDMTNLTNKKNSGSKPAA